MKKTILQRRLAKANKDLFKIWESIDNLIEDDTPAVLLDQILLAKKGITKSMIATTRARNLK